MRVSLEDFLELHIWFSLCRPTSILELHIFCIEARNNFETAHLMWKLCVKIITEVSILCTFSRLFCIN